MADPDRKIAVVTGANRGLGLETSRRLSALGYHVVLTARDAAEGTAAARAIDGSEFHALDVTDAASIQAFKEFASTRLGRIDSLVNNAGISMHGFNAEVARGTMVVNFFGPLHLTEALRSLIPRGGVIVMVSSGMGELSGISPELGRKFTADDLTVPALVKLAKAFIDDVAAGRHSERGWPSSAYRISKVSLNALTRLWARELDPAGIKINAVCAGWVRTRMAGSSASRSVEQGAKGIVWAATLGEAGPSGGFFRDEKPIEW